MRVVGLLYLKDLLAKYPSAFLLPSTVLGEANTDLIFVS